MIQSIKKESAQNKKGENTTRAKETKKVPGQVYLGVMEGRGRRGGGGSLWGGALQKRFGGIASSSIGQTI